MRNTLEDKAAYWVVVVNHDGWGLPLFLGPAANEVDSPDKAIRFHEDDREGAEKTAAVCGKDAKVAKMTATWKVYE